MANRITLKVNPSTAGVARMIGAACCTSIKGFIFCASTGRSGTNTLQRICAAVPSCTSLHHPHPIMYNAEMTSFNAGDPTDMRNIFWMRKMPRIYKAAAFKRWYVETNHIFIKCFSEEAVKAFGKRLQVIHLVRDRREVACSFLLRNSIPGAPGNKYLIDPAASANHLRLDHELRQNPRFAHDYFKCLWYCFETEARLAHFRARFPHVPIHFIQTPQLNDLPAVQRLLRAIGMEIDKEALARVVGTRANASHQPPPHPQTVPLHDVQAFETLCQHRLEESLKEHSSAVKANPSWR